MRAHRNADAARVDAAENGRGTGVSGIFENDGVTGANKSFGDEIQRLLAAVGDEKRFVFRGDAVAMQKLQNGFLERRIAIGSAEIENFLAFPAADGSRDS